MTTSPPRPFTLSALCPVCGTGTAGCSRTDNGLIFCRKRNGPVPGFRHLGQAKGDPQWGQYRPENDAPPKPGPCPGNGHIRDWQACAQNCAQDFTPDRRKELADYLGLPEFVLQGQGIGYLAQGPHKDNGQPLGPCWTFPLRDGAGRVLALLCRYRDGQKKVMTGGHGGLFLPAGWKEREGPIYLPEGASCTLALTALNLAAIGRFNNTGGVDELVELLRPVHKDRPIVVVAEWDPKPDGQWPGRDGAIKVAAALASQLSGRSISWVLPPGQYKDVRTWVQAQNPPTAEEGCQDDWDVLGERLRNEWQGKYQGWPANDQATASVKASSLPPTNRVNAADLLQQDIEPTRWVVPELLPEGLAVLAGRPKKGKSWLALDLALCVARGVRFLDRFDCPATDVLYLALEDGKPRLFARLAKMFTGHDLPKDPEECKAHLQALR